MISFFLLVWHFLCEMRERVELDVFFGFFGVKFFILEFRAIDRIQKGSVLVDVGTHLQRNFWLWICNSGLLLIFILFLQLSKASGF